MDDILMQAIIFVVLVLQGAMTRVFYAPTVFMQKRINRKAFTFVSDIMTALIGAAGMMLTCFLLAGEVRIFYSLFYLGGIALTHILLKKFKGSQPHRKTIAEIKAKKEAKLASKSKNKVIPFGKPVKKEA